MRPDPLPRADPGGRERLRPPRSATATRPGSPADHGERLRPSVIKPESLGDGRIGQGTIRVLYPHPNGQGTGMGDARGAPDTTDGGGLAAMEPPFSASEEPDSGEGHEHVDCPPDRRTWLEAREDEAATMRPHAFCVRCGKVKHLAGPRAKPLGFYLSGLAALKDHLAGSAARPKMTQSQSRLITKALEGLPDFEDGYALGREAQARLYVEAVQRVRPDLDPELVLRMLPRTRRDRRPLLDCFPPTAG